MPRQSLNPEIFRSYDVRGIVEEYLTPEVVKQIGHAFGSEQRLRGQTNSCVVGRDGRISSPELTRAVISGLRQAGIDVIDIGLVPTPVVYFATYELGASGSVMVTGSHNPVNYNGLKFSLNRLPFAGHEISGLLTRINADQFKKGQGGLREQSALSTYVERYQDEVSIDPKLKVVVDCGNGASGILMRKLLDELGIQATLLFEEVDGSFPNHHPDPSVVDNLQGLIREVLSQGADLGIAFDGDGDRIGVVTEKGDVVPADQLLALFASDILQNHPGRAVIFDVKCGNCLREEIDRSHGKGVLSPTGHTNIKSFLRKHDAVLAGELSGHICFPDRWYPIDDAAYAGVRLMELLTKKRQPLSTLVEPYNQWTATEELFIQVDEHRKFEIVESLKSPSQFEGGKKVLLDGVRVEFEEGWGLVRASNTSPVLSLRFEAVNQDELNNIRDRFAKELGEIAPDLTVPTWP